MDKKVGDDTQDLKLITHNRISSVGYMGHKNESIDHIS